MLALGAAALFALFGGKARAVDYPGAASTPASTRNYQPANRPVSGLIQSIVIHVMQSGFSSAVHWFANPRADVSAHYSVRAIDGAIAQSVPDSAVAWHAGNRLVNAGSIGIEHEGFVASCAGFTETMYRSSARLAAFLVMRYAIPVDRQHIFGHSEVPNPTMPDKTGGADGHTDPGRCWRWSHYLNLIKGFVSPSPLNVANVVVDDATPNAVSAPDWKVRTALAGRFGSSSLSAQAGVSEPASFSATLPATGFYAVYGWWPPGAARSPAVPLTISTATGPVDLTIDQTRAGAQWYFLGVYPLAAGSAVRASIDVGSSGVTVADAFKFEQISPQADAQFVDSSHGFALGASGLLASADACATLAPITPPGVAAEELRGMRFIDPLNGWVAALVGGVTLELYRTADGGVSWTTNSLPVPADLDAGAPVAIDVVDSVHVFVNLRRVDTGAFAQRAALVATSDGGATWKSRPLPAVGPISFTDPRHGWLAAASPAVGLYRTTDAGRHWRPALLPPPADADVYGVMSSTPVFSDTLNGSVPVTVLEGDHAELALYTTVDGGNSWLLASVAPTAVPLLGTSVAVAALNVADWVAALDQGRRLTSIAVAAGGEVSATGSSPLSATGGKGFVAGFQRLSPAVAFAIVERCSSANGCHASLVRTLDGAQTWSTVAASLS